jgi:kumamolisin
MTPRPSTQRLSRLFGVVLFALGAPSAGLRAASGSFVVFPNSIRTVPTSTAAAAHTPHHARVTRTALRADETGALMTFEVALRMRNFDDLQSRVARGELISKAEKEANYFPTAADHDAVVRWLKSEGLTVTRTDDNRLAIFGRGTVGAVARAFLVTFARVTTDEGEFTSAVTAPSLPAYLASAILGVHGFQPHIRPHRLGLPRSLSPDLSASPPYYPAQIAQAYNANGLSATGAGQTIAIYAFATPLESDLTTFWSTAGVAQSTGNIQTVDVAGGPASPPSTEFLEEATLDVEWSSSLAPGATIRIYAANENDPADNDEILQQVYADLPGQPNLHTLSICIGGEELEVEHDYLIIEAQYMANLASAGVTVLSASGDTGAYADDILQVTYPTSDPDVTGVGGTTLILNPSGAVSSETAWNNLGVGGGASGGGVSVVFTRPAWQTGAGVTPGTMRLVPDVAAAADPNDGALLVFNGQPSMIGGTSWATPTWAAFCALIDQTRAGAGLPPVGLLNSTIYPLIGTAAFRDITSGSNGYYNAGPGYDLCTGIGVPDVQILANAMLSPNLAPIVAGQLGSRASVTGQPATFSMSAFGASPLSYQWQRLPNGQSTWSNLTDSGTYSGSVTPTLVVDGTTLAMSGDEFQCVVSNALGSAVSSPPAVLTVNNIGATTLAGWPGAAGSMDGTGWAARFSFPGGIKVDSAGAIYVADSSNYTVRQITQAGAVTTLAGTPGKEGSTNGSSNVALFGGIGGVAPDALGNVYVADSQNYTIRMISASGNVSTLAGLAGSSRHVDGAGSTARFSDPQNLAVDFTTGNIYVADGAGNTIRMVTPAGVVSTLAGSGVAGSTNGIGSGALFRDPTGIAVDASGNVYVADTGNDIIREITPTGTVTTLAGTAGRSGSTDGTNGRFDGPAGVAVDASGNVYVADTGNSTIREIAPSGAVVTIAGSAGIDENIDGLPLNARFWAPSDIAVDSSGTLFIADSDNMTIRRLIPGALAAPSITAALQSQTAVAGSDVVLSVAATGTEPLAYQWNLNGIAITGATSATLTLANVGTSQAGTYTVTVTNALGSVTSNAATLTVNYSARLDNLSARAYVGTSGNILIAGFNIGGTGTKNLLLRGVGPTLAEAPYDVAGVLSTPQLTLYDTSAAPGPYPIVTNIGWGNPFTLGTSSAQVSPQAATATLMNSVGAFPLNSGSADCAVEVTPPTGGYTSQVTGVGSSSGVALAEIYDADTGTPTARLTNISARAVVGVGGNIAIGGFEITGTTSETVLIRGVGPGLASEGIPSGFLAQPQLTLFDTIGNGNVIASNSGWSTNPTTGPSTVQAGVQPATPTVMNSVGAFPLTIGSADAAMVVTLPPGGYTAQVNGVGGTIGITLVEVYEIP